MKNGLKLIVGLGNPGSSYVNTRHNAGCWWLEQFCIENQITLKLANKMFAHLSPATVSAHKLIVAIPNCYMNESGKAIAKISNYYAIETNAILVVHDELDFAPGQIKFKTDGGHAGHNGLRDITANIGTNFHRLRIGIGHPGHKDAVSAYVLSKPSKHDKELIQQAIIKSLNFNDDLLNLNFEKIKGELNGI